MLHEQGCFMLGGRGTSVGQRSNYISLRRERSRPLGPTPNTHPRTREPRSVIRHPSNGVKDLGPRKRPEERGGSDIDLRERVVGILIEAQRTPVVDADLLVDDGIQLGVHRQDQVSVRHEVRGQVHRLLRVGLVIE